MEKMSLLKNIFFIIFSQLITNLAWSVENRYIFDQESKNQFECEIEIRKKAFVISAKSLPERHLSKNALDLNYLQSFQVSFDGPFVFKEKEINSLTFSITFPDGIESYEDPSKINFYTNLSIFDNRDYIDGHYYNMSPIQVKYDNGKLEFVFKEDSYESEFLIKQNISVAYLMSLFELKPLICSTKNESRKSKGSE